MNQQQYRKMCQRVMDMYNLLNESKYSIADFLAQKMYLREQTVTSLHDIKKEIEEEKRRHGDTMENFQRQLQQIQNKCPHICIEHFNDCNRSVYECMDCGLEVPCDGS